MKIRARKLIDADYQDMKRLLLGDGPNDWNYITEQSIKFQFDLLRDDKASAILAEDTEIVGFAVLIYREACPAKITRYGDLSSAGYINDVVVAKSHSGKGLGTSLLNECQNTARREKITKVYIERHEENMASAGMMRKSGFETVETFYDPEKRTTGSRKTTLLVKSTGDG